MSNIIDQLIKVSTVNIVSVLHQDEGGIGKSIPDAQKISRDPRDFPREISRVEGNLVEILVEHGYSLAQETEKI